MPLLLLVADGRWAVGLWRARCRVPLGVSLGTSPGGATRSWLPACL